MNPVQLHLYIEKVRREETLQQELIRIQSIMVGISKRPHPDPERNKEIVANANQIFRTLLAEKARQKIVEEIRQNNASHAENGSPRPTDNTA